MVGPTLIEIREHIEELATEDGRCYVVCGRTGDRPVPATGTRFSDRATARAAAQATEQYRSALRRYDPQVPHYDLIVCGEQDTAAAVVHPRLSTDMPPEHHCSDPTVTDSIRLNRHNRVEFCHRIAGAVFEALSGAGYDDVERAVMDAYFDLAETVNDLDELCLCLLESMASELAERVAPVDQAKILADAAARLESPADSNEPLDAALTALGRRGLIESYARSPWSVDLDGGAASVVVRMSGYALSAHDGRLPVLPLTVELSRHHAERPPQSVQVTSVNGGWQLTFVSPNADGPDGLVSAPIDGEP